MTIAAVVARARERLIGGGVPAAEAPGDVEVLARHVLGWDLTRYALGRVEAPPPDFTERFDALLARRLTREPVSQILGHREFWGLDFEVTRDVLTPRPETELVVQAALDLAPAAGLYADIGTGSGCIAIALAKERPAAYIIASDASSAAIAVARRNAVRHGVDRPIAFLHTAVVPPENDLDVILSNPPYIPLRERDALPPEVREYEPALALFGGDDGLDFYRQLLFDPSNSLVRGGWMIVEVGYDQATAVRALARPDLWTPGPTYRDLQGIERVLTFRRSDRLYE